MNGQWAPEMNSQPTASKPQARPHRLRACLVYVGVVGTLTTGLWYAIERSQEAAARAH